MHLIFRVIPHGNVSPEKEKMEPLRKLWQGAKPDLNSVSLFRLNSSDFLDIRAKRKIVGLWLL